ncbi:MAG TPA: NrfD/PsrC family molybdoenzyme membrane anchor subunit [Jatrophihabitans sp.]
MSPRRGRSSDGAPVVPDATFTSYYGRPVVKKSPWEADIPAYLFLGGLAAGSSLLGAGADVCDRPSLRRTGRLGGLVAIALSFAALVHDLGKPARFVNMLRVAKPTSPMSVGTWILSLYGPAAGLAGAAELPFLPRFVRRLLRPFVRPAGLGAAAVAPAVATYTGVLLAHTATPAWNSARRELPIVFAGSAASAAGGLGMVFASVDDAGPARRFAVAGAALELAAEKRMEQSMGLPAETLHAGKAGTLMRASRALTTAGALGAVVGRRSRVVSALAGTALLAGSACTRFGIFEAGQASADDPKYTVVPQRERLAARGQA